jgi:hypothetical protein
MLNECINVGSVPLEHRAPTWRPGFVRVARAGSGGRHSGVQLRRVRSDYAQKFSLGGSHLAAMPQPLRHIITF